MRFIVNEIKDKEYVFKAPIDTSPTYVNPDAYVLTNRKFVGKVNDHLKTRILVNIITKKFGIFEEELFSKKRDREIVEPRQLITYMIKKETELSLAQIGMIINRDHATVLHSVKAWNNLLDTEQPIRIKTREVADEYMQKIWEVESDKTLSLDNEEIIANWEKFKDKTDQNGNFLYR